VLIKVTTSEQVVWATKRDTKSEPGSVKPRRNADNIDDHDELRISRVGFSSQHQAQTMLPDNSRSKCALFSQQLFLPFWNSIRTTTLPSF
jgi:hypothetical protein